jgi:MFS family permease
MALGVLFTAPALVLVVQPVSWWWQVAAMIPFGAACSLLLTPTLPELAHEADRTGDTGYGAIYALFNVAYGVGMFLGPMLGGALAEQVGLPAALAVVSGGALFLLPVVLSRPIESAEPAVEPAPIPQRLDMAA